MKHTILRGMLIAAPLLSPLAAFAEAVSYYDCRNADGSMTYRIFPCSKGQQEVRKQTSGVARVHAAPAPAPAATPTPAAAPSPATMPMLTHASVGDARRDFEAGNAAYLLDKHKEAAALYRKAAELGYAAAQFSLGSMYEKGEGMAQDYPQAASWYRKAAEQEFAPAQYSMGVLYDIGQGVTQDYRQALSWYGKAAERGSVKAQNNLGFMYSQGKGVAQDYVTAHMWFNISGVRGYEEGRKNREFVEKLMTPEQVAEAQQKASAWMEQHPPQQGAPATTK